MNKTPWELMLTGQREQALRLMRDSSALKSSDPSETMQLGVAYLWVGDYVAAWEHFNAANQRRPKDSDCFYHMAGAAKWCLGDRRKAVEQWLDGIDCNWTDGAGGIGAPLLLFTASIIDPDIFSQREAEKLLNVRANDPLVRNWPGPVAEYVLGRIDERGLQRKCVGVNAVDTSSRNWFSGFYVGILERAAGNVAGFIDWMREVTDPSPEYTGPSKGRFHFVHKLWTAEFFIARDELARQQKGVK